MVFLKLLFWILASSFPCRCSEVIEWRYSSIDKHAKRIEANNWFQLEYLNQSKWISEHLSWHFHSPWCEISNASSSKTFGRCNLHGEYGIGIQKASNVIERRILVVKFSHMLYSWELRSTIKMTEDSAVNVDLQIWVAENDAENAEMLPTERSKQLTKLFFSNGERPLLEVRNVTRSSGFMMVENAVFNSNASCWKVSFTIPVETKCIFVKSKSTTSYSLFDKLIRDTTHTISTAVVEQEIEPSFPLLKSSTAKLIKNPCAPTQIAFLSSNGIYSTIDSWQESFFPISPTNFGGNIADDLVFSGNKILLLVNGFLTIVNREFEVHLLENGLRNVTIKSIFTAGSCHQIGKWRNIVVALSSNDPLNSPFWFYLSYDSGSTFSPVDSPEWQSLVETNNTFKAVVILDVQIHSVISIIRFLIRTETHSRNETFLVDYCYTENKWKRSASIGSDEIKRSTFLLSTSDVTLLWSDKVILKNKGNSTILMKNFTSQESKITNVITDGNGRFVVELESNELYTGMIGVNTITKISPLIKSIDAIHSILDFDAQGRLTVSELLINDGMPRVISKVYPLFAEIDSATRGQNCKVVAFSHNMKQGWYQIDVGQQIQFKIVMVSKSSDPFLKVIRQDEDLLHISTSESTKNLGRYTEKTILLNITTSSSRDLSLKEKFTTLVVYPSNITLQCTSFVPQTAFLHLGCPKSTKLVLSNLNKCDEDFQSSEDEIAVSNEIENTGKYCASVMNEEMLNIRVHLTSAASTQNVPPRLFFQEIYNRNDFTVSELTFEEKRNLQDNINVDYNVTFHGIGEYRFVFYTNATYSFCDLQANLEVTVEPKVELSNSVYVITSVCLGISFSFLLLLINFLLYRHRTIEAHRREAEIVKRQQELRFLTNLRDFRENISTGATGRRKSSALREGLRMRNASLSVITEKE